MHRALPSGGAGVAPRETQPGEEARVAYKIIVDECTTCGACEAECPNEAIFEKKGIFRIDPEKCTECEGHYDTPQCAAVCPIPDTCVPAL
jgi:ferredoxin